MFHLIIPRKKKLRICESATSIYIPLINAALKIISFVINWNRSYTDGLSLAKNLYFSMNITVLTYSIIELEEY